MSELLNFEMEDGEECGDNTEEDLLLLGDATGELNLFQVLHSFFSSPSLINTSRYQNHIQQLLKEDLLKLQLALDYYNAHCLSQKV